MSNIKEQLNELLEAAAEEHRLASNAFTILKNGHNARRLSLAMDNLEKVVELCEANGIVVA